MSEENVEIVRRAFAYEVCQSGSGVEVDTRLYSVYTLRGGKLSVRTSTPSGPTHSKPWDCRSNGRPYRC
jgi:hypothetical protein